MAKKNKNKNEYLFLNELVIVPCSLAFVFFRMLLLSSRVKQFLQSEDVLAVLDILEPQAVPNLSPTA